MAATPSKDVTTPKPYAWHLRALKSLPTWLLRLDKLREKYISNRYFWGSLLLS